MLRSGLIELVQPATSLLYIHEKDAPDPPPPCVPRILLPPYIERDIYPRKTESITDSVALEECQAKRTKEANGMMMWSTRQKTAGIRFPNGYI